MDKDWCPACEYHYGIGHKCQCEGNQGSFYGLIQGIRDFGYYVSRLATSTFYWRALVSKIRKSKGEPK